MVFHLPPNHTFLSGTLENGEARLLFSSAQVEYIRYWLHTMGFTKDLIPLPYSDCLLTSSRLQNHSPVVYKTGTELRSALKVRLPPLITAFRAGGSEIDPLILIDDRQEQPQAQRNGFKSECPSTDV